MVARNLAAERGQAPAAKASVERLPVGMGLAGLTQCVFVANLDRKPLDAPGAEAVQNVIRQPPATVRTLIPFAACWVTQAQDIAGCLSDVMVRASGDGRNGRDNSSTGDR